MSTPELDDDLDLDDDDVTPDPQPAETPKDLRRAAADGKAARAEATRLARENAMLKAGIDTDSPVGKMFATAYDGELDKEAVKAAWSALGLAPASAAPAADEPPADPDPQFADGEQDLTGHRQALANGSPSDTPPSADPRVEAKTRFDSVINAGGKTEDALAASLDIVFAAAHQGDKRVIVEAR